MLTLLFILIAIYIGVLSHYLHPIELDGRNVNDTSWHRPYHVYRRMHHE
jgi:hypothetical protein